MKLRSSVFGWKSVWMDLAEELRGEFVDGTYLVSTRLPVHGRPWKISMQMHANPIGKGIAETTVIGLPYVAKGNFRFAIRNSSTMEEMAKIIGLQDLVIGHDDFDRNYIIQGNDHQLVKEFFGNAELRTQIQGQKTVNIAVVDRQNKHFGIAPPAGVHVLTFTEKGAINSFERLTSLYELMIESIERLCEIEAAAEHDPEYLI